MEVSRKREQEWECVIGLEVHVELSTAHKAFCGCETSFGDRPNRHTCPVCMGLPGALPVLNREMVRSALALGQALGCRIEEYSRFDRKNYFYPDNPKNYQITQFDHPVCRGGGMEVEGPAGKRNIRIREIHMEEDAGKITYDREGHVVLDFNRAGIPLLELVTLPDFRHGEEVVAFLEDLQRVVTYLGISDGRLQEGSMRADVNLSVRPAGSRDLGVRTETKNLNSYKAIRQAIAGEYERQIHLLEAGEAVVSETRRWDEERKQGIAMRPKESVREYRYFPDPDLPPLRVTQEEREEIQRNMPLLHRERARYLETRYGIGSREARILTRDKEMADLLEALLEEGAGIRVSVNWLTGDLLGLLRDKGGYVSDLGIAPGRLACLLRMLEEGNISNTVAKKVFEKMYEEDMDPEVYIREQGLAISGDEQGLVRIIGEVMDGNDKSVRDYLGGKKQALGYLIGQTMKAVRGAANPEQIRSLLQERLNQMEKERGQTKTGS